MLAVIPSENDHTLRRTFVLAMSGDQAKLLGELPQATRSSWRSGSGTTYCPTTTGQLLEFQGGVWNMSPICERTEKMTGIAGVSGATSADDTVFVLGQKNLHVRERGQWRETRFPDSVNLLYSVVARTSEEAYVCTDDSIFFWNGKTIAAIQGPDDEIYGLVVVSQTDLLAAGDAGLYRWQDSTKWKKVKSPARDYAAFPARAGEVSYFPSNNGLVRYAAGNAELHNPLDCMKVVPLADDLLLLGRRSAGTLVYVARTGEWRPVQLPALSPDEKVPAIKVRQG